ncbi:MAG: LysR family transcriptional regulator [Methylophilaceae bacterium]|nr:LysR family transcriptional regulator [Methylophilaceae bacterium]
MGPGKADLLDAVQTYGSISAAAKSMKMSYRRAWELVDLMNQSFQQPLVRTSPGGNNGGGAQVTEHGLFVLNTYRTMVTKANLVTELELNDILASLNPIQMIEAKTI